MAILTNVKTVDEKDMRLPWTFYQRKEEKKEEKKSNKE